MKNILLITLIMLACSMISCDKKDELTSPSEEETLTVTMPRPKGWLLGTWTATMPEYISFGQKSSFAGKKIKMILTKEHTLNIGYWYEGKIIWDEGSSNSVTFNLISPGETPYNYIQWVYDKAYDIENLYLEVHKDENNYIELSTTNLGAKGTTPVTISFDWQIKINGIYESSFFINQLVFYKQWLIFLSLLIE